MTTYMLGMHHTYITLQPAALEVWKHEENYYICDVDFEALPEDASCLIEFEELALFAFDVFRPKDHVNPVGFIEEEVIEVINHVLNDEAKIDAMKYFIDMIKSGILYETAIDVAEAVIKSAGN